MSNDFTCTVDDDFTMEVLEGDDYEDECTIVTIKEELEDIKPEEVEKDFKSEYNGLALPLETKKELKHFLSTGYKSDTKSKCDTLEKAAMEFKTLSILREYKDMITEGFLKRPFKCPVCQCKSNHFSVMLRHVDNHLTQQKEFKCSVCNFIAFSKGNLTMHRARCVSKYKKSCPHCPYTTIRNKTFRIHVLRHTAKFSCTSCRFYSSIDEGIEDHKKNCTLWAGTNNKCDVCDFRNEDDVVVTQHTKEKHPEYQLKCDHCEFVTLRKKLSQNHRKNRRRNGDVTHKCDQCDFRSCAKTEVRKHMKDHTQK